LPAVVGVKDQDGEWSTVGQTRLVQLGDGTQMREELVEVNAPEVFGYRLTEPTGPMKFLVTKVDGRWNFTPTPSGVSRITWTWAFHPRSLFTRPMLLVIGVFWRRYAALALDELAPIVEQVPISR
jgi:hypothetical protein